VPTLLFCTPGATPGIVYPDASCSWIAVNYHLIIQRYTTPVLLTYVVIVYITVELRYWLPRCPLIFYIVTLVLPDSFTCLPLWWIILPFDFLNLLYVMPHAICSVTVEQVFGWPKFTERPDLPLLILPYHYHHFTELFLMTHIDYTLRQVICSLIDVTVGGDYNTACRLYGVGGALLCNYRNLITYGYFARYTHVCDRSGYRLRYHVGRWTCLLIVLPLHWCIPRYRKRCFWLRS